MTKSRRTNPRAALARLGLLALLAVPALLGVGGCAAYVASLPDPGREKHNFGIDSPDSDEDSAEGRGAPRDPNEYDADDW